MARHIIEQLDEQFKVRWVHIEGCIFNAVVRFVNIVADVRQSTYIVCTYRSEFDGMPGISYAELPLCVRCSRCSAAMLKFHSILALPLIALDLIIDLIIVCNVLPELEPCWATRLRFELASRAALITRVQSAIFLQYGPHDELRDSALTCMGIAISMFISSMRAQLSSRRNPNTISNKCCLSVAVTLLESIKAGITIRQRSNPAAVMEFTFRISFSYAHNAFAYNYAYERLSGLRTESPQISPIDNAFRLH